MTKKKKFNNAVSEFLVKDIDDIEEDLKRAKREEIKDEPLSGPESEEDETDLRTISPKDLVEKDFYTIRKNLHKIIKKGNAAVDKIVKGMDLENTDFDPKRLKKSASVADLCDLLKTLVTSNKELLTIHETKSRILNPSIPPLKDKDEEPGANTHGNLDENGNLLIDSVTLGKVVSDLITSKNKSKDSDDESIDG